MPVTLETLMRFCGDNSSRYSPPVPWVHDGWTYATNGSICVRVPRVIECPAVIFDPPPAQNLEWGLKRVRRIALPAEPPPAKTVACEECGGKGKRPTTLECEECEGDGDVTCDACGHDHDCERCGGKGEVKGPSGPCADCGGTGQVPRRYVAVRTSPGFGLSDHYARLLVEAGVREVRTAKGNRTMAYFALDDAEGIVTLRNDGDTT